MLLLELWSGPRFEKSDTQKDLECPQKQEVSLGQGWESPSCRISD